MRTLLATALALIAIARSSTAQTVLFSDSFESGLSNWTATGLWHSQSDSDVCGAQKAPFPDGHRCVYYGVDGPCNFDTGTANAGKLTLSTPITLLTGYHAISLHCWMMQLAEPCSPSESYDLATIDISTNSGSSWTVLAQRCASNFGPPSTWNPRWLDLTSYAGQSISIRFTFDTLDNVANDGFGVLLDHFEIQGESGQPICAVGCPCEGAVNLSIHSFSPSLALGGYTGCGNSYHLQTELSGEGATSVSNDGLTLRAIHLPPSTIALLVQSSATSNGVYDGEGFRCLSGPLLRIGTMSASNGIVAYPAAGSPPLSVAGFLPLGGGTRGYQICYRDVSNTYCNATNFNWTNGYSIVWGP